MCDFFPDDCRMLITAWHVHFLALTGALGWFKNVFFFFLISKTKKDEKLENKSKKVKQKKKIQKSHSGEEESSDENTSEIKQPKQTKEKHQNDSHISSDKEVDISRGEGDMQSSSDEEDEGNLRFEIAQVWTLLQCIPYYYSLNVWYIWRSFSPQKLWKSIQCHAKLRVCTGEGFPLISAI